MRHLITAGLPYINGVKHLGNLVGSILPADVYARFLRRSGHEVLYICATDEHGAPAELAAEEAKTEVSLYCERQFRIQADIYERFSISFDHFGRSSSPQNADLTQRIAAGLMKEGYMEAREIEQVYSIADGRFLPDRYIVGTCPHCGFEDARGDQCENCTRLLDPTDLIDARSAVSGSRELEIRSSQHLFLKLPELEQTVRRWVESQSDHWPALSRQIASKWLKEGLHERCITRDLNWGVSVPFPGFEDKVFYVWFDAPIEYIGATWEWSDARGTPDAWRSWWLGAEDVRYTQFMGKDNLPFHTIMFPAMLLGSGESWKLADQIKGFHWLNYYGGKFSTSQKRGVFTDAALDLFPADYWRYFLMTNVPESSDAGFTWRLFAESVNKDLAGVLGNFANRILKFCAAKLGPEVPVGGTPGPAEKRLSDLCREAVTEYEKALENLEFRVAIRALRRLWTAGNQYVDEQAPWRTIKEEPSAAALTMRTSLNLIRLFAVAADPFTPTLASRMMDALRLSPQEREGAASEHLDLDRLVPGAPIEVIPPIVDPIDDTTVEELEERFSGIKEG